MTQSKSLDQRVLELFESALDQPSNTRTAWITKQAGNDKPLLDGALALLLADGRAMASVRTGGGISKLRPPQPAPTRIGAYRIAHMIGQGGMGVVYAGDRDLGDFEHHVAIKVIRSGLASGSLSDRFNSERRILASLSHTGIAKLFDGGALDDGSPYMVMERINGTSITKWAEERTLSPRERIKLFQQVLRAIGHAHQNLIIHRDITPNNVLVTEDGTAKVIDFGIAIPQLETTEASTDLASLNSLTFTPGFSAPERERGAAANILSDIYSLGKLLDALLPARKRRKDLSAIIARASAIDPDSRYASTELFLADLNRYLEKRPVEAYQSQRGYAFGRFFARHPLGMIAGMLGVGLLTGGLLLTTMLYQRAEASRLEADQRFADVQSLAQEMLTTVYNEIRNIPASDKAATALIDTAQTYLNDLSTDRSSDLSLKYDTGRMLRLLARLQFSNQAAARDIGSAFENLQTAGTLLLDVLDRDPGHENARVEAIGMYYDRASFRYTDRGELNEAIIDINEAINLLEQVRRDGKLPERFSIFEPSVLSRKAEYLNYAGRQNEAVILSESVVSLSKAYLEANPENEFAIRDLAIVSNSHAGNLRSVDRPAEALVFYNQAIDLVAKLNEIDPNNSLYKYDTAYTYDVRGGTYLELENFTEALNDFDKSLAAADAFLELDPGNEAITDFKRGANQLRAATLIGLGRFDEARIIHVENIAAGLAMLESEPLDFRAEILILRSQQNLIDIHVELGEEQQKCEVLAAFNRRYDALLQADRMPDVEKRVLVETRELPPMCA